MKLYKLYINFLLIAIVSNIKVNAQDYIYKTDQTAIKCKVINVNGNEITYNRWDNLNGPIFTINKSEVMAIYYQTKTSSDYDIIFKTDESQIQSKISKIGENEIEYKKYDNMDGPSYTINKSDVIVIHYMNGSSDFFTVPQGRNNSNANNTNVNNSYQNQTTKPFEESEGNFVDWTASIYATTDFASYLGLGYLVENRSDSAVIGWYGQFQADWAVNSGLTDIGNASALYYLGGGLTLGSSKVSRFASYHLGFDYDFETNSVLYELSIVGYGGKKKSERDSFRNHVMVGLKFFGFVDGGSPFFEAMIGLRF